ncbi:MAG: ATP synthase F1 subunit epsilon [Candidatus Pacebacteria bacterium]|nr:ATP synthase F1 subunit epsilon [Candidatus Paceibacterota bacterium]
MSTNTLKFKIATPDRVVYENDVEQVSIPTTSGEITVHPNHISMVTVVKPGELRIIKDGQILPHYVAGGTLEIRPDNTMVLLANISERAEDIDIAAAEDAYNRACEAMERKDAVSDVDFAKFQGIMERELSRMNVAKKWRK